MLKTDYKWHFDFVRLALDTGFTFERHKKESLEKDRIYTIDIDRVIQTRDLETVEKLIPYVIQYSLDADQARILDDTFVKTFRLSQLSIEYLLFCKQYLDNSLIYVKNQRQKAEEENNELKLFVDELKQHIAVLMKELKDKSSITTYQCNECTKMFSTDEFLKSHQKRRHNTSGENKVESTRIHSEIKELKGRLNSAEKMMQSDQHQIDNKCVDELQQKFENLRLYVESELKVLGAQQNFAEKYEKWVEKLSLNYKSPDTTANKVSALTKKESSTQTETVDKCSAETIPTNVPSSISTTVAEEQDVIELAQQKISMLSETLEAKVSFSLHTIEQQMAEVFEKIGKINENRRSFNEENLKPPVIKPRSKFTSQQNDEAKEKEEKDDKVLNVANLEDNREKKVLTEVQVYPVKILGKKKEWNKKETEVVYARAVSVEDNNSTQTEDEEEELASIHLDDNPSVHNTDVINKSLLKVITSSDIEETENSEIESLHGIYDPVETQSTPSNYNNMESNKADWNDDLVESFQKDVETILNKRLQDMGVSPEWRGLPIESYKRALQIVQHQASLLKKVYPNFDQLAVSIERDVVRKMIVDSNKPIGEKETTTTLSSSSTSKKQSPQIEIKNRKMYDTDDSDSDLIQPKSINPSQTSTPFAAVIEELKTITKQHSDEQGSKSVLKNYPSVGSLSKKKVLFDLNSEEEMGKKKPKVESMTSLASSGVGTSKIEDLSDCDFST